MRIEGQKTAAYEIVDALEDAPDYHALPVGNAGNIGAYWKGFNDYYQAGLSSKLPKMIGFQAAGASPIVQGKIIENPETIATAIRVGNPASWINAVTAQTESGGLFDSVTDEEIIAAYKMLGELEGIFCEPASAISLAGLLHDIRKGKIPEGSRVVCTLTGHGLKDPDTAIKQGTGPLIKIKADLDAVKTEIFGNLMKQ